MRRVPGERLRILDPLLSALGAHGFIIASTKDTDPGLLKQLEFYAALVEHHDAEKERGRQFLNLIRREAEHLTSLRNSVYRGLTVAFLGQA